MRAIVECGVWSGWWMNCGVEWWGGPRRKGEREKRRKKKEAATEVTFAVLLPVGYHNLCSHAMRERLEGGREEEEGRDGGRWFVG